MFRRGPAAYEPSADIVHGFWAGLMSRMNLPEKYHQIILWIGDATGAPDALLHVHAGMAVLIAARLITGRSLATPIPFAVVCLAELLNEVMDRLSHGSWQWPDTSLDVVNTLFWPFIVMIGLRVRRAREGRRPIFEDRSANVDQPRPQSML